MEKLLRLALSGGVSGAIYSLVGAGLVLSYTATGIFNFAYGSAAFASAYVFFTLNSGLHWPIVPAALATIFVFAPLLGIVLDAAVFRPLARATEAAKVMATVGLMIAVPALTKWILDSVVEWFHWRIPSGTDIGQVVYPPGIGPVPKKNWKLPINLLIDSTQVSVFVVAAVVAVGLWYLMKHTPLGLRMRAVVDRPELAETRGIDQRRTSRWAWIIGMVLAATAGVVGSPVILALSTFNFTVIMFVAAAAAVIGGLRSIPVTFAAGLGLGIAQNLVNGYADGLSKKVRGFPSSVPFLILLLGLLLIARDRSRRGGRAAEDVPPIDPASDLPQWRRRLPWIVGALFLAAEVFLFANKFWVSTFATGLATALVFLSFTVVTGLGGMVSLAQAAFVGVAALTAGLMINRYHLPFLAALVIGAAVATVIGVVVALPALRLGGVPLALATLALALIGETMLFAWDYLRNENNGWKIRRPSLGSFSLRSDRTMIVVLAVMIAAMMWIIHNLRGSSSGRSILAVRASEPAAATSGISPVSTKLGLFAVAAAMAGVGGVMYATVQGSVSNQTFPATLGLVWLANAVLFGIRRPGAQVLAGISAAALPVVLRKGFHFDWLPTFLHWDGTKSTDIPMILFGLGAVQLARHPDGFLALNAAHARARRDRRRARAAAGAAGAGAGAAAAAAAATAGAGQAGGPLPALRESSVTKPGPGPAPALHESSLTKPGPDPAPALHESSVTKPGPDPAPALHESSVTKPGATVRQDHPESSQTIHEGAGQGLPLDGSVADQARATTDRGRGAVDRQTAVTADRQTAGADSPPPRLSVRNLSAGYGSAKVLHGITLDVPAGQITALLGPNGSGKSTLCKVISGLVVPTVGDIALDGRSIVNLSAPRRCAAGIIAIPESRGIFPGLSVDENLAIRLDHHERDVAYDKFPILGQRRHLHAGSLSGGEQQMLAMATLLVRPPDVVIADEPTLGLAPMIVDQILELFTQLRSVGVALLLVEEKSTALLRLADHVAVVQSGRLAWSGPAAQVDDQLLTDVYLGGHHEH